MNDYPMNTGHDLNAWRKRMRLTLKEAAIALGLTRSRLTDILYNRAKPPTRQTMLLAQLLEARKEDAA